MVGSLHNNAAISQSQDNRERIKKKIKMGDRKKKNNEKKKFHFIQKRKKIWCMYRSEISAMFEIKKTKNQTHSEVEVEHIMKIYKPLHI